MARNAAHHGTEAGEARSVRAPRGVRRAKGAGRAPQGAAVPVAWRFSLPAFLHRAFRGASGLLLAMSLLATGSVVPKAALAQNNAVLENALGNNALSNGAAPGNGLSNNGLSNNGLSNAAAPGNAASNGAVNSGGGNTSLNTPAGGPANEVYGNAADPLGGGNAAIDPLNDTSLNDASLDAGGDTLGNVTAEPAPSAPLEPVPPAADPMLAPAGETSSAQAGALAPTEATRPVADSEMDQYSASVETGLRTRLSGDLQRYCLDYCNILSIDVSSQESFDTASTDLGFEGAAPSAGGRRFSASGARAEVMVDTRFGTGNIERLQKIFARLVERYPLKVEIQWSLVTFPDTGTNVKSEAQVRADFAQSVRNQLERVVAEFCPRDCRVHALDVSIARAGVDEVQNGNAFRYLFSRDGRGALYVRGVTAIASLNSFMDSERKDRIRSLMNETLLPFGAVNLQVKEIPFPRSAEDIEKDKDDQRGDPWGLKRLGEALKIFREFANTKEIIRESQSTTNSDRSSATEARSERERSESEKAQLSSSERSSEKSESERAKELASKESNSNSNSSNNSSSSALEGGKPFWTQEMMLIAGAILLALVVAGALGLRWVVTGKRMQQVINEGMVGVGGGTSPMGYAVGGDGGHAMGGMGMMGMGAGGAMHAGVIAVPSAGHGSAGAGMSEEVRRNLQLQTLRDELIQIFVTQPKVARDVFGRMIREDGIENTSKLVVIFGEMMIFELLGDADLKKEIYTLAEYVHVNAPSVPVEEQLEVLRSLRLKMTAGKMRLMTSRTLDMFDFLKAKSARQIWDLINDETARSQAIVLTQLSTEKRRAVFELFEGQAKVDLLRELSNNNVVQREYLYNVAEALKRKALTKPSFDGENVQGIDVLLDLLERAELQDQRDLMADLDRNSTEIARMLRTRLVTVETLPYLRDGLLLEIFLSMEANTMATFLAGTREHIRNLILSKAPPDVADNWVENLESIRSIDSEAMRLAELQVIGKVRSFANQGLINMLDINTSLYPKAEFDGEYDPSDSTNAKRVFKISNPLVA